MSMTRTARRLGVWLLAAAGLVGAAVLATAPARAVPAFSHQTGQACAACHIGGYGPQLTPYGRQFKLTGYSEQQGSRTFPPVSAMVNGSFARVGKDQPAEARDGYKANNNARIDEAALFLAGRITDNLGAFIETNWSNEGGSQKFSWDNIDVRYGREVNFGNVKTILGVTVNNSPTVSDVYNSTPTWGFPYQKAGAAPSPASTLIEDGLGGKVIGAAAYGLVADMFYFELGGYAPIGSGGERTLGVARNDGPEPTGFSPYWRAALQYETLRQNASLGFFGLVSDVYPNNDRSSGLKDHYRDLGIDASYQWIGNKTHMFTVNTAAIFEHRALDATYALGGAENKNTNLNTYRLTGSYIYDQSYTLTLGGFKVTGSRDAGLYADGEASVGSITHKPNSAGYIVQADWTPWGKKDSWMQPFANAKLSLQYIGYTKFNGGGTNYDGEGRKASDNNTTSLLFSVAF